MKVQHVTISNLNQQSIGLRFVGPAKSVNQMGEQVMIEYPKSQIDDLIERLVQIKRII